MDLTDKRQLSFGSGLRGRVRSAVAAWANIMKGGGAALRTRGFQECSGRAELLEAQGGRGHSKSCASCPPVARRI